MINSCTLSDTVILCEPSANYNPLGDSLLARAYFKIMGIKGDPVYRVENCFGLDLLSVGELLFCAEDELEQLDEMCGSYEVWGSFCLKGRNWNVPVTEVLLSDEVFGEIIEWRDSEHTPDWEPVYGDALTLCAVSSDGALHCKLADLILTENGEWMLQYIIWEGEQGRFSTEPLPCQWFVELSPALKQIAG